jgi:Restriction endonuclease S subunits
MNKWKTVKLENVAKINAGQGAPQGDQYYSDIGLPFIRAGHLLDLVSGADEKTIKKIEESIAKNHKLKVFPEDTILFAKSGMSCLKGYVYRLKNNCYVVNHLACIIPQKDLVYPAYLKYTFIFSPPNRLIKDEAYPSISLSDISKMIIPLPPLKTQQKIADVLDRAGALIEKRKAQIEKLDLLIKSQFIEMFGDPLIPNPKWDFKRLGDITTVVSGSTPKTNVDKFWDGTLKWITPAELSNNTFYVMDSERHITELGAQDLGLKPFPAGTVILSSRAPIGKVAIAGTEMYCNQGFKNLICSESISPIYLFWMLKQKTVYLNSLGRGATFKEISKRIVEDIKISIPPLVLQTQFADFVQQVEAQKSLLQQSLEKLELNYKSLMQKCFRGDLF